MIRIISLPLILKELIMKVLLISLTLFFTSTLFSQNFGLVGVEWYHSISSDQTACAPHCGYIHSKSMKDTLIQGKTCYKIVHTTYNDDGDTLYSDPLFVYNQADTTFAYSFNRLRFLKLLIFNANQGDTITLDYPPIYFTLPGPMVDSTYRLVIDTVVQKSIDGVPLKEYQTTGLDGFHFYCANESFMDRIGGLDWLHPRGAIIPETDGAIRCYRDAQIDTSFTNNACDFLWITAVSELESISNIKLYPNPSSNNLVIENVGQQKSNVTAELRSVTGELVFTQKVSEFQKTTINTNKIPVGVYFVVVKDKSKIITTQKWVKVE